MKTAGRVLATMIAMVAILLIAVGADKGLNYLERIKYEKECEELYAESHAQAEQLRTQLEELSQDEAAVETFLHEYAVDDLEDEDEDVLQEFLTASPSGNGSEGVFQMGNLSREICSPQRISLQMCLKMLMPLHPVMTVRTVTFPII